MNREIISIDRNKTEVIVKVEEDGKTSVHAYTNNRGILIVRRGESGISLARNLSVGDIITDENPEARKTFHVVQ